MNTVSERVSRVMAEKFQIDADKITEGARMDELGVTSIDVVETIMSLEDEFGIEIPDAAAEKFHTVGDVVAFLAVHDRANSESRAATPGPNLAR